ncbi:MAG: WhiB family transcriptional regulator [Iamia sp.]
MGARTLKAEDWTQRAACRGADTAAFFPERGASPQQTTPARQVYCSRCPVAMHCLSAAMRLRGVDDVGIWGGTSPGQRVHLRKLLAEDAPERYGHLTDVDHPAGADLDAEPDVEVEVEVEAIDPGQASPGYDQFHHLDLIGD